MLWGDLLAMSLASLKQRAFRTSLTMLGVVIGTTAVVVMVSLGVGMSATYDNSLDTTNLRQVTVSGPPQNATASGLPDKLNDAMVTHLQSYPGVELVWPTYSVDANFRVNTVEAHIQITGMPRDAMDSLDLPLAWGRLPAAGEPLALIVGEQVSTMFWDERTQDTADVDFARDSVFVTFGTEMFDPNGQQIPDGEPAPPGGEAPGNPGPAPKRVLVPVVAQISDEGKPWSANSTMVYTDLDALVRALEKQMPGKALPNQPASASGAPVKGFVYTDIRLYAESPEAAERLMVDLREQGYDVSAQVEWIRQAQQQGVLIQAVFGGIGFISLLVAAIGIANTMLMSVYERTREIGIMKVLGASLSDIRKLFLIESASIGFFGGLAGLLVSLVISMLINATLGASMTAEMGVGKISIIPFWLALGSVAFSTLIGTVAGLAPAQRATKLSPLAAIRNE
ncbi:ABC transporter permease [Enemella sp. A6]|uniref:ABC transporter permease n=1 Tax=Enemella sp. A6 TaxID=3440152 RepID=UPI003EBEFC5B